MTFKGQVPLMSCISYNVRPSVCFIFYE